MCRLICTFDVHKPRKTGFFALRPRLCTVNFPIIKIKEHSKQVINVLLKNKVTLSKAVIYHAQYGINKTNPFEKEEHIDVLRVHIITESHF